MGRSISFSQRERTPRGGALGASGLPAGALARRGGRRKRRPARLRASLRRHPVAAAARNPDKLILEANELVYDKDHNTVTAVGAAQLYYKHRILQADRVVYNRATKRLYAEGHAKLTDEHGNVTYASRFDLTDDFAAGFAEGVEMLSTQKTRFTAPRVERSAGAVTVFSGGVYTACEPCKDHPERPPFWQIRAARIIENQQTHIVYYEDAWLEVGGVPIAYVPYFSAADPSVTRASGFLAPTFYQGSRLGYGVGAAVFLQSRAQLRPDADADLPLGPGPVRRGPVAPTPGQRRIQHPRHRALSAEPFAIPARPLRLGRSTLARLARERGRVLHQRQMEVRLGPHRGFRSLLSQRLQGQEPRRVALLFPGHRVLGLSARPGGSRVLRPERLSISRARPPPPTSGRSRTSRRSSTTTRRSPSRPIKAGESAAR